MKKKFSIVLFLFLIAGAVKSFGQTTINVGQSVSLSVANHPGNAYRWGLYLDAQAISAANSTIFTLNPTGNSATLSIAAAGTYYVIVIETDGVGCSAGRSIKITVLPNNLRVLFPNSISSACFQANNDFSIPIQFKDLSSGLPLSSSQFPMTVSFQVNGVDQPAQTISFASQNLVVAGSSFTANPNSDTPVVVTINGATDSNNLMIQPETTSAQNIHTHTIFRILTAPTVASLITNNTTPAISGTAIVGPNETFSVLVNGITYVPGDGNLVLSGTNWTLQIPASNALPEGTYEITATVSNASCSLSDPTTNELIIDTTAPSVPTVISQVTNDSTPTISGTATVNTGEKLTVTVNGVTYTTGDGHLTLTGTNWSLQIPTGSEIPDGTYPVTAVVTDAAGNTSTDTTTNELVVDTVAPLPLPTVTDQVSKSNTPVIQGTATLGTGDILKVFVNGVWYQLGDGHLTISGSVWSLKIPAANQIIPDGVYPVTVTVTDAAGNTSTNSPPGKLTINTAVSVTERLATNDINVTFKNMPVSGNVLTNDAGFNGFNPTFSIDYAPLHGTASLDASGRYTYTPAKDFIGTDNFYYIVSTVEDPAARDTVNVTIQVISDVLSQVPPVASDDEMQTTAGVAVHGNVLTNDFIPSGETLILNTKPKDGPKSGTLVLKEDGSFSYTPNAGFTGQDYFVYEVCGAVSGFCAQARATITVASDPLYGHLFASDDVYFSFGKPVNGNLLTNDLYPSASSLTVKTTPVVAPVNGTVTINSNGTFSYLPASGFAGTDWFVYQICDSKLNRCDQATAYVVVKEAPATFADLSIQKTGPASVGLGESVSYHILVTNLGTAVASNIQINDYLPAAIQNPKYKLGGSTTQADWSGSYDFSSLDVNKTFTLTISGSVAANAPDTLKNRATVTSLSWDPVTANNISEVNTIVRRGPVARISGASYQAVGSCNTSGKMLDASKSGGTGLTFSWSPSLYLSDPSSAKPVFVPGKTTRYHLTVTDSQGLKDTASVLIVVANPPQAITDKNVFVKSPKETILLSGSKSTGAGLSYLWLSHEGIILNGETTPTAQVSGLGMYYLQVTDSLGCSARDSVNVGLYIQAVNDTASTKVNESVIINVVKNDIPQKGINPSSISIVTPPLHGIAAVSADSLILYQPEQSYIGQDEFVYAICDYFKQCDQAKVLVLINDLPFFIPEAFSPNGDGINDKFEIKGLYKYKTVELVVFNRWGNIVYQSNNYGEGNGKDGFWDGKAGSGLRIGSGPVPTGTYFYILTLNGKEKINGSFYLDR